MRITVLVMSLVSFLAPGRNGSAQTVIQDTTATIAPGHRPGGLRAGISLGTNGLSGEVARHVRKDALISVSLGYRFYQFDFEQDWGKREVTTTPDVRTAIVAGAYEWFPFKEKKAKKGFVPALKVKGGLQYVFRPVYRFTSRLAEDQVWGQVTVSREQVGVIHTTVTTQKLQPFTAAGYDPWFRGKKYSFGADAGWVYHGKPRVKMEATNMLEASESQASIMERNLRSWQAFPFVHLRVNYRF